MPILAISEWTSFFGRFHPLFVHLPIGFLIIAGVFEILKISGRVAISQEIIKVILIISAISATLACIAGYFLSLEGGYNDDVLEKHKMQGIWLVVFCWMALLAKNTWLSDRIGINKLLYAPSLVLSLILLMLAGHNGGNLTHGETYLTENTPQPFRTWLGMSEKTTKDSENSLEKPKIQNINEAMIYQDIIRPIFKQKCEQCHNANKMKGDLRIDEVELFKKGGKHGAIFVANKVDESEFIKRILLPESDDDHMPPKGKIQISENDLALMKWWIEQGAPFDKKVSQIQISESVKPILASLGGEGPDSNLPANGIPQDKFVVEEKLLATTVSAIDQKILAELKKSGALVLPFAQNNNFIEISYINNSKFSDNQANIIANAPEQTLWLKLNDTQITDKTLIEVAKLTNLTRLHLEQTKITDSGLKELSTLKNLEYLNLIGTTISDKGINNLSSLKNLKKLYLWKTNVTTVGAEQLKKSLPGVKIDLGMTEQQIADFLKAKPNESSDDVYKKK
ncbi:c-type cytochrome domain-containing protein [Emticicia sp. BO119]|uniref:c-type cytochrome domain-containing protein n=1 Tax=Emticicia sp. BO119 TaxID=2757768 RepID=UPI0015F10629|nr:c-type cytochrome domain-containing protein [Emticicia sp. BO119]MBA4853640.1 ribonuclease inhibitor [Emticicia sp. BO119]